MRACDAAVILMTILRRRSRQPAPAVPTLGELLRQPYWTWLRCNAGGHEVAVGYAVDAARRCSTRRGLIQRRNDVRLSAEQRRAACSLDAAQRLIGGAASTVWPILQERA
jgi:hypothetical protein